MVKLVGGHYSVLNPCVVEVDCIVRGSAFKREEVLNMKLLIFIPSHSKSLFSRPQIQKIEYFLIINLEERTAH